MTNRERELHLDMIAYLEGIAVTSENIGNIRRSLFMPFECKWNGYVRDATAAYENKSSQPAPVAFVTEPPVDLRDEPVVIPPAQKEG